MADWPLSLPKPANASLVVSPRDNVAAFDPDVGPRIVRRRSTARLIDYQAQLYLTAAQRVLLDTFFHDTCQDGALSFTMSDWLGGLQATFQFAAPPSYSQAGPSGKWFATVALVKLP